MPLLFRLLGVLLFTSLAGSAASDDYAKSIEAWRTARVARLTTPDGWLSLIGRHRLSPGENSVGTAADNSIKLAAGPPYLGTVTLQDGKIILDFNRAQNPPCAFTPFATCPLPPRENRLPIRVTAGEKIYRGNH